MDETKEARVAPPIACHGEGTREADLVISTSNKIIAILRESGATIRESRVILDYMDRMVEEIARTKQL